MFEKHWCTGIHFEEASDCTAAFYSNQGSRHIIDTGEGYAPLLQVQTSRLPPKI
jgi:hypothetical protein